MFQQSSGAQLKFGARLLRKPILAGVVCAAVVFACGVVSRAQGFERELDAPEQVELVVKNRHGRVTVLASEEQQRKVSVRASSLAAQPTERDVRVEREGARISIHVERETAAPTSPAATTSATTATTAAVAVTGADGRVVSAVERNRIDVTVRVPLRARVRVETEAGAVDIVGGVASAEVQTYTGTIRADVPLEALRYDFRWTLARPRFYSEVELEKVRQTRVGYEISGRFGDKKAKREERIELDLETARGVILFGVSDEAAVPSDLRERELTESARAIIRSGDEDLTEAIRRIAPRLVGDYSKTLPPRETAPALSARRDPFNVKTRLGDRLARLQASVTDRNGRAIAGLTAKDFAVVEDGEERPVRTVEPSSSPFNLVLLLDVSGSVEERLDFIRKAALAFVNTVGAQDRVAIVSFREDVQVISDFTADKSLLAKRIKAIQAGGGTALYDSIAYSLVHTLKPLRGERTAIVVLSDGDDNRSFIPFPAILEAVVESGALIYPLYVPSGLIPADSAPAPTVTLDPMRARYLTLTSRAEEEGRKLASVSGGAYYPVTRLEQLQRAFDDVVAQLRTSYSITYESKQATETAATEGRASRVRVRVAREGANVRLSPAVGVTNTASP